MISPTAFRVTTLNCVATTLTAILGALWSVLGVAKLPRTCSMCLLMHSCSFIHDCELLQAKILDLKQAKSERIVDTRPPASVAAASADFVRFATQEKMRKTNRK